MIVSRGMGVVGKGPGLAQNALFHFPLGYDVRGEDHGLRTVSYTHLTLPTILRV